MTNLKTKSQHIHIPFHGKINGGILQLCKPNENQSIGIIFCKSVDKAYVEYAVRGYDKPMGVVTY